LQKSTAVIDASSPLFFVLAFYRFVCIENPPRFIADHKRFFKTRNLTSRIYISENGINGQMSGSKEDAEEYMKWMHANPLFEDLYFKIHTHHENVFPKKTIKYRKQLVALDEEVDLKESGDHLSPKEWKEMLESDADPLVLDVRNEYEWKVGRFQQAECPPCQTFRDFKEYAEQLKKRVDPKKKAVMMYCTGGIRCELYSSLLKKGGFEKIYQLDGGIINYGLKQGKEHWLGKVFVFDDRLTVPICDEPTEVIGKCHACDSPSESYYNCANMDCNHLFLCCPSCLEKHLGCCSQSCKEAPRVRPYHHQNPHKPFRKGHHYFKA